MKKCNYSESNVNPLIKPLDLKRFLNKEVTIYLIRGPSSGSKGEVVECFSDFIAIKWKSGKVITTEYLKLDEIEEISIKGEL